MTGNGETMIEVTGLSKSFDEREVLIDINFTVEKGTTLSIMGSSGVGKSTLMKILIGAIRPDRGRVKIAGVDIAGLDERGINAVRKGFGVLFQDAALLNSMTIGENVALPILYHGKRLNDEEIDIMVTLKLNQVALLDQKQKLPEKLSGGQRKRAGLARALALDPRLLFYDEPTSGLDPKTTAEIDSLINEMKSAHGMTSVVVTHDVQSAYRISDRIIILGRGNKIVINGTVEEVRDSTDPEVRDFLEGRIPDDDDADDREFFLRDLLQL